MYQNSTDLKTAIKTATAKVYKGQSKVIQDYRLITCEKHGVPYYECLVKTRGGGSRWFSGSCPACRAEEQHQEYTEDRFRTKTAFIRENLGEPWHEQHEDCWLHNYSADPAHLKPRGYSDEEITHIAEARQFVENYVHEFDMDISSTGKVTFWFGLPGTGKDHLAVALYREVLNLGYVPHIVAVEDLLTLYGLYSRGAYRKKSEIDLIKIIASVDLLILNEFGLREYRDSEIGFIQRLLSRLHDGNIPVVLIGNIPFESEDGSMSFTSVLGDRIMSRSTGAWRITFDWQDYRKLDRLYRDGGQMELKGART